MADTCHVDPQPGGMLPGRVCRRAARFPAAAGWGQGICVAPVRGGWAGGMTDTGNHITPRQAAAALILAAIAGERENLARLEAEGPAGHPLFYSQLRVFRLQTVLEL